MNKAERENSAEITFFRVETGVSSCFSSNRVTVEILFEEANALAQIEFGGERKDFVLTCAEAKDFLLKIVGLAQKEEVLSGSRGTIFYRAEVRWQNLNFIEAAPNGKIESFSNEFPADDLKDFLVEIKDEKITAKLKSLLEKGLHRRALEIYRAAKEFTALYFPRRKN